VLFLENQTTIYTSWVQYGLNTSHAGIMPWQFGALDLTEDGGNRVIEYTDAIINGASPNDGLAIYKNETALWDMFAYVYLHHGDLIHHRKLTLID
jgi:mannan endo-1,4-beta-mannosidase